MLPGRKYAIEDFLRIAWRGKWLILLPFVVVSIATVLVVRRLPDLYRSDTTILVIPQRVPESYVRATVTDRIGDRLQSLQQQILSRSRLERIIIDLNLYRDQRATRSMEDLVVQMRSAVKVDPVRGDAFTVSYISLSPKTAQIVTERLATLFIQENVQDRGKLAQTTSMFLQVQLDDAKKRLIEQEKKLEEYRLAHAGELPSQAPSNLQGLQSGRMQLQALVDSLNRERDRQVVKERELADLLAPDSAMQAVSALPSAGSATSSGSSAPVPSPVEELAQARAQLQALEGRLTEAHPDVRRLRRRVTQLEAEVQVMKPATAASPVAAPPVVQTAAELARERRVRDTRAELDAINRRILGLQKDQQRLQQEANLYQARLEAVPIRESEQVELMRDYATVQDLYRMLLAKHEESKIARNMEAGQVGEQFRVLDPALVPQRPFSPDRVKLNGMGILFGLVLGLGLVAALEFSDSTLKSEEDIRTVLGLPVIATIPIFEGHAAGGVRRRLRWLIPGASVVVAAADAIVRSLR